MKHSGRLIVLLLILVIGIIAAYVPGPLSAFLVLIGAGLGFALSVDLTKDFYAGSFRDSFLHHISLVTGWGRTIVADKGKTNSPEISKGKPGVLLGPARLIVKPQNAVLTTLKDCQSKLYGKGTHSLEAREEVTHVFDLSVRYKTFVIDNVLTRDKMLADVRVGVTYNAEPLHGIASGHVVLEQEDSRGKRLMFLMAANWDHATRALVEEAIRRHAQTLLLQDLLAIQSGAITAIEKSIEEWVQSAIAPRGVRIEEVDIESIMSRASGFVAPDTGWEERSRADGIREALTLLLEGDDSAVDFRLAGEKRRQRAIDYLIAELRKKPEYRAVFNNKMNKDLIRLQ